MLSVIIPTLNAESHLPKLLAQLAAEGEHHVDEIIVSDGGSTDTTLAIALSTQTKLAETRIAQIRIAIGCKGRGWQLARGANWASGDWLLFLHADTQLGDGWLDEMQHHINHFPTRAGYFRLKFAANGFWPRWIEFCVRLRCAFLALPYGDQGLLIRRDIYKAAGGYPDWQLFEDVQIVRTLGRRRLRSLKADAITSAERYEKQGYRHRSLGNLRLLMRFLLGANPDDLSKQY